ncbi:MAG: hypothetical protein ACNA7W_17410 [Pseudomonadales bacterium]
MSGADPSAWSGLLGLHQRLLRRPGAAAEGGMLQPAGTRPPRDFEPTFVALEPYRPVGDSALTALRDAANLDDLAEAALDGALLATVGAEGPVHLDVLVARLLAQVSQSRSSARLRGMVQKRLQGLAAAGVLTQQAGFSAMQSQLRTPPYRDWRSQNQRLRRLDHVHDRELMQALWRVVDEQEGASTDSVMNDALHRIGFIRLTANARERLAAPLAALLEARLLASRNDRLWLGEAAFQR